MLEACRSAITFLDAWRRSIEAGCRWQGGIFLAAPIIAACMAGFIQFYLGSLGFLALSIFLQGRRWRRILLQISLFMAWLSYLAIAYPNLLEPPLKGLLGRERPLPTGEGGWMEGEVMGFSTLSGSVGESKGFGKSNRGGIRFPFHSQGFHFQAHAPKPAWKIQPGQRIRLQGIPIEPGPPTNPGQFDYPKYIGSRNMAGIIHAESIVLLKAPPPIQRAIASVRFRLEDILAKCMPPDQVQLVRAAMLGSTDLLEPEILEDFQNSGMLHLLAISGQHIGLLALILLQFFSLLRVPRKVAFLLAGMAISIYAPLTGNSISVVRSVIMFWFLIPPVLLERPSFTMNNLALAAAACLIWMPYQILSLGFQLSFLATFVLILYARPFSKLYARWGLSNPVLIYIVSTFVLSLAIFMATLPLLAATVHQVSPLAPAGNVATVFLSSALLLSGVLAVPFSFMPGEAGMWMGEAAGLCSRIMVFIVRQLSHAPQGQIYLSAPAWWDIIAIMAFLLILPFAMARRRAKILSMGLGMALATGFAYSGIREVWLDHSEITFLDIGQGDAIFCKLPGANILIDAGPGSMASGSGKFVTLPFLKHQGIRRIDLVIITHADLDHYGGLLYLIPRIRIGKVLYNGFGADTRSWRELESLLHERGIPMEVADCGNDIYRRGNIYLKSLGPCRETAFGDRNNNSVVTLLQFQESRLLLTGDIESPAERSLARKQALIDVDILKVSHHGSDGSSSMEFLKAASPAIAIVPVGRKNRYGHPGSGALERLRAVGCKILVTAISGAIMLRSDRSGESVMGYISTEEPPLRLP